MRELGVQIGNSGYNVLTPRPIVRADWCTDKTRPGVGINYSLLTMYKYRNYSVPRIFVLRFYLVYVSQLYSKLKPWADSPGAAHNRDTCII